MSERKESSKPASRVSNLTEAPRRLLFPVSNIREAEILLPLAVTLADGMQGELIVLALSIVDNADQISELSGDIIRLREMLLELLPSELQVAFQVRSLVAVKDQLWESIWNLISQENIKAMVLGWASPEFPSATIQFFNSQKLADPPCDLIVFRSGDEDATPAFWKKISSVLIPMRGGENSGLALRVGQILADNYEASITLLHITSEKSQKHTFFEEAKPALIHLQNVRRSIVIKGDVPTEISTEANKHQVTIIGAPTWRNIDDPWSGPLLENVIEQTSSPLVIVKEASQKPGEKVLDRFGASPRIVDRPVHVVVDKWFAERTFHSNEFSDLGQLVALKEAQNLKISLGLPALNEAKTVGKVISTLKTALMENYPLLDEIVLVDSGSVDYTREIAEEMGVPVFIHQEVLPQHGSFHGKGEALWKSLYLLDGDIIAWVDTDIVNIHPRFVYGVIGPLLSDPTVQYVKGFYRRPLRKGDKLIAGGGGRVTELTVRPLFNLFYPELSGLIQPLSGEYAGRRSALENLPFFTGYGVETGLLIDILENYGLNAIAQCDLLERIHHNQPLQSLSKMSFTIMQAIIRRLEARHRIEILQDPNLVMNVIRYGSKNYYLEGEELKENERPPIIELPEYRQKMARQHDTRLKGEAV